MANRRRRDMVDPFAIGWLRSIWSAFFIVLIVLLASCKDNKADPTAKVEAGSTVKITPEATSEESTTSESTTSESTTAESEMPAAESTTQTATTVEPAFTPAKCQFNVLSGSDVECAYLVIPEKHAQPDNGRTLRQHVAIFKSDSQDPAPDPVVYSAGGPGAHALEASQFEFETTFASLLADRDLVMFDQRGTGYSEPSLDSPELIERFFHGIPRHVNQPTGIALRTSFHTYRTGVPAGLG